MIASSKRLVPDDFPVPLTHAWTDWRLEPLSLAHAEADRVAVLASASRIRHVFGPANEWPPHLISDAENRADLARHEREFAAGLAYAYSLLGPRTDEYRGCVYLRPVKSRRAVAHRKNVFDAQAFLWLAESWYSPDQDAAVARDLQVWFDSADWPFRRVAWPGRFITWTDWQVAETDAELAARLA